MRPRLIIFFVVVLIVIGVVVVRVGALQTLDAKQLSAYGATQRRDREILPASRGIIFDRNHEELGKSQAENCCKWMHGLQDFLRLTSKMSHGRDWRGSWLCTRRDNPGRWL